MKTLKLLIKTSFFNKTNDFMCFDGWWIDGYYWSALFTKGRHNNKIKNNRNI